MGTYDAAPATTHDPATGVVVPVNWLDLINANFTEIGAAWNTYTPSWTSTGTAPAIGNGTRLAAYKKLGKLLFVRIYFAFGSTTTFGTGFYSFSLPSGVTAASGFEQTLSGKANDSSAATNYILAPYVSSAAAVVQAVSNAGGGVSATSPFTWANGDSIVITGSIETA